MEKKYDYLIVGAGLFGATFAYCAKMSGKHCLLVDRRDHVGGNIYCEDIQGINVHKYGPHIFHTSNRAVWNFVNSFVEFNRFTLESVANYKGEIYNLPFNMNTFYQMWHTLRPDEAMRIIEEQRFKGEVHNLEEQALSLVGRDIYEKLIKGYTEKQWGRACNQLPSFIIRRLPVRLTYDNNYFCDTYQGIPVGGYNHLIEGLLEGCDVRLGIDFFYGLDKEWRNIAEKLVYTGKLDDFYYRKFGSLQYRSLRFEHEMRNVPNYQAVAIMNFTDKETPYTRIIEHKHFQMFGEKVYNNPNTIITREYPQEYLEINDPYYPINNEDNNKLYLKYRQLAENESDVIFGGRLAEYKYYNMDDVIQRAWSFWNINNIK